MEREQAERFVAAAARDYWMAVGWYCVMVEGKAEGPEEIVAPRADVLAAQQVLDLARNELRWARQDQREREAAEEERVRQEKEGEPNLGVCDACQRVGPLWRRGPVALCRDCREEAGR